MAGTQTHGFDMVIEISAQTIQNLLSATFDSDGLLGSIIPGNIGILDGFGLNASFSRPPVIAANAVNPIQLIFTLNFTNGTSGTLEHWKLWQGWMWTEQIPIWIRSYWIL